MCACAANNTCHHSPSTVGCNSDALPQLDEWRYDGGFITNTTALPATGFTYQYLHETHQAKFAFGPLQCWGSKGISRKECVAIEKSGAKNSSVETLLTPENRDYEQIQTTYNVKKRFYVLIFFAFHVCQACPGWYWLFDEMDGIWICVLPCA